MVLKVLLVFSMVSLMFFQNCSDVRLSPILVKQTKLESKFCLKPPENKIKYSKIIFVVDMSGSNGTTDSDKSRRFNAINGFFSEYRDNQYYKWHFMVFSDDAAESYTTDETGSPGFVGQAETYKMDDALGQFDSTPDAGGTPYLAALSSVRSLIRQDLIKFPEEDSVYNIFFISDGSPTPGSNDGCVNADCPQILSAVNDIGGLLPGSIFLSTAYYYGTTPDANLADGLRIMAREGNGTYSNAGNGEPILFNESKIGEVPEPWVMKGSKIVVYNMNSAYCTDARVGVDSDADGICDSDEELYNIRYAATLDADYNGKRFDPLNRNSLHEDYSDSFVWKFDLTVTASGLPECVNKKEDEDFDFLNSCEESLLKDLQNANGPEQSWTDIMVNKFGGMASPTNFDSDGDMFLDFLEFFTFRLESAISVSVDYQSISRMYAGGVSAETIMEQHRHFMTPDVFTNESYDIKTFPLGLDDKTGQQCFELKVNQLGLYPTKKVSLEQVGGIDRLVHKAGENQVLFYFISTPEDRRLSPGILNHTIKTLNNKNPKEVPRLIYEDFQQYKVPRIIY